MIKHVLTYLMVIFFTKVTAQIKQTAIEDNQYIIEEIASKMKIKKVDQKKLKWTKEDLYGWYEGGELSIGGNSILKNEIVSKYFTNEDIKFIEEQYTLQKLDWNLHKGKYKVLDSLTIKNLHQQAVQTLKMKYYYHSLSAPLFSINKQFMIIKIYFYCGVMCGSECVYLFQKKENEKYWTKISKWNCLAE